MLNTVLECYDIIGTIGTIGTHSTPQNPNNPNSLTTPAGGTEGRGPKRCPFRLAQTTAENPLAGRGQAETFALAALGWSINKWGHRLLTWIYSPARHMGRTGENLGHLSLFLSFLGIASFGDMGPFACVFSTIARGVSVHA
jgi:hypothetical protein